MGLMNGGVYDLSFDPASMARIAALMNTAPIFEAYYLSAMRFSVNLVVATAQEQPYAPRLTGNLARGIQGRAMTPWLGKVSVLQNIKYAARREFGYDGQKDRLGREFIYGDPLFTNPEKRAHMMYLHRALEASRPEIGAAYRTATSLAIREIAGIGGV